MATRSVQLDGIDVEAGQIIGVANGKLCASGTDLNDVLTGLLEEMDMGERELVTVYYGLEVDESQAKSVAEHIRLTYPNVEVELLYGGQPIYQFILGAE